MGERCAVGSPGNNVAFHSNKKKKKSMQRSLALRKGSASPAAHTVIKSHGCTVSWFPPEQPQEVDAGATRLDDEGVVQLKNSSSDFEFATKITSALSD